MLWLIRTHAKWSVESHNYAYCQVHITPDVVNNKRLVCRELALYANELFLNTSFVVGDRETSTNIALSSTLGEIAVESTGQMLDGDRTIRTPSKMSAIYDRVTARTITCPH